MTIETQFKSGSPNIFADLGLPNPEELLLKAELIQQISNLFDEQELSLFDSANILGIDETTVENLLDGKLSMFSIDRLFRFLNALGSDIEIRVIAQPQEKTQAEVRVIAC